MNPRLRILLQTLNDKLDSLGYVITAKEGTCRNSEEELELDSMKLDFQHLTTVYKNILQYEEEISCLLMRES